MYSISHGLLLPFPLPRVEGVSWTDHTGEIGSTEGCVYGSLCWFLLKAA